MLSEFKPQYHQRRRRRRRRKRRRRKREEGRKEGRKATPLLGTYPKESKSAHNGDACTPVLIGAQFTVAKS
jgi:hypothetical protein